MAKHDYSNHPAMLAAKAVIPPVLMPGKPVAMPRALLKNMAVHEVFKATHGMRLAEAVRAGLVTLTSDAPAIPTETLATPPPAPPAQQ